MFAQDRCFDMERPDIEGSAIDIDVNVDPYMGMTQTMNNANVNTLTNMNYAQPMITSMPTMTAQTMASPIIEPVQEKQVHREIVHEVPHVCPIRTRVINHHIYKHTYSPQYSCCEENQVSTINCGSCCNFR